MGRTLVIAEPGCTHEGDFDTMIRLLETAATCGADVFKPQWVSDVAQMLERRHILGDHPQQTFYARAYGWLAFPLDWHARLRDRCAAHGLTYACTAFLREDVATLAPYVDYLKISSFEAGDTPLINAALFHMFQPHRRVLVSTGMHDGRLFVMGCALLQCVSSYPAPLSALNLGVLWSNEDGGSEYDGLSDHSRHLLTGAVAVGAGASIIETHFRLDDCDPENPDYPVAFTPAEFRQYVQNIRDAEIMLGDGVKRVQECERAMLPYRVRESGAR